MKKTNTIIIAAAFLLVGCMFAHVGCIPYDPSMMESYWGAQSGGNSIFDNDANNWNGSAGESLFQTPNDDTNYVTQNLLIKALYKRITGSSVGPAALGSNNRCSEVK